MNERPLLSKSILVLGATSTLAKCTYQLYARNGFNLILAARNWEEVKGDARDTEIRYGVRALPVFFDAEDPQTYGAVIRLIESGLLGIMSFVGYLGDQLRAQSNAEERHRICTVNYSCPSNLIESSIPYLDASEGGFIIGVGSVAGDRGRKGNYTYGAAKGALEIYFSGLRNRLVSDNINVLFVKPGFMETKMTAHLALPRILTANPDVVAKDIYRAQMKRKDVIYSVWFWRYIMYGIRLLPERIFKHTNL